MNAHPEARSLVVSVGGREVARIAELDGRMTIGRDATNQIAVDDSAMSSLHAELISTPHGTRLRDLDSLNGTFVNGERAVDMLIRSGDEIEIGNTTIIVSHAPAYEVEDAPRSARSGDDPGETNLSLDLNSLRTARDDVAGNDERLFLLRDLSEALKREGDRHGVVRTAEKVLERAFSAARVLGLVSDGTGGWRPLVKTKARPSATVISEAADTRRAVLSARVGDDGRFAQAASIQCAGIVSVVAAPVIDGDDVVAVLYADRAGFPPFDQKDLSLVGIAANYVALVIADLRQLEELKRSEAAITRAHDRLAALNDGLEKEVVRRTEEIRRQADEIEQLAAAKDAILGIAAHDIRGPLQIIQGMTEILLSTGAGAGGGGQAAELLELVHNETRKLGLLLSSLLDAQAIRDGKVQIERRPVPALGLFQDACPLGLLAARERGIDVEFDVSANLTVSVDPARIGQVIANLFLNAVKFCPPGSRIVLGASPHGDHGAELRVEDNGPGMSGEELEQLFGRFQQGAAGRRAGGTGLGLAIAKQLIELHGGRIWAESSLGVGTCVRFTTAPDPA